MKKSILLFVAAILMIGCGSGYEVYDYEYNGEGFSFEYPSTWTLADHGDTGLTKIEDPSGTPLLSFSNLSGDFGMEGWEMQKEEDFVGENGVEFSLIFNKVDVMLVAEGDWPEGEEFMYNDTTLVMISTAAIDSPMFYRFDKTDPEGEVTMKKILDSFEVK